MSLLSSSRVRLVVAVVGVFLVVISEAQIDSLVTPEDVRFSASRCQNQSRDTDLRAMWSIQMYPDNHETHCYVKCFLSKLGLINLETRGLEPHKFIQPVENKQMEITEGCFEHLDEILDGTCRSYYTKWMSLREHCDSFIKISLFEDPKERDAFHYKNPLGEKAYGESATEFCDKKPAESNTAKETSSSVEYTDNILSLYKCNLECVFHHFRYFDAYGRIDESEILRSIKEAGQMFSKNAEAVKHCTHRANTNYLRGFCEMAYELKRCLQQKVKNFKYIYQLRDKTTHQY